MADEFHRRERARFASELLTSLIKMVQIQVNITAYPDEFPWLQIGLLSNHELKGNGLGVVETLCGHLGMDPFRYGRLRSSSAERFDLTMAHH